MDEASPSLQVQHVTDISLLKLLADPIRLAILRQLMAGDATLSQLSRTLGTYPARVRHHVKVLANSGLIVLTTTRIKGGFVEKYYRATARAFVVNLTVLPQQSVAGAVVAWGSHDLALEMMARSLQQDGRSPALFTLPVGSLDGLIALRQGVCQIAGAHLWDAVGDDYNRAHVRHLFPGEEMILLTLAHREQGLLVAAGNPRQVRGLADLRRSDLAFINRARGTGTRLWLDEQLRVLGLDTAAINGYQREADTHLQVAQSIAEGSADVGLAIVAAAEAYQLDVVPLFAERYDLVVPAARMSDSLLQPVFDYLQSADLRRQIRGLAGYSTLHTGEVLKVPG